MINNTVNLTKTQRLNAIRNELLNYEEVSIEKLAQQFNVSGMTVRRDFDTLESNGEIIRTFGGASLARKLTFEFSFKQKQNANLSAKSKIAAEAVRHISDGQVIILDTGTTTLAIAEQLTDHKNIAIITTSLAIVSALQFAPDINLILLGGFLRGGSPDLHGPLTENNIEQFRADICFIGADAIDEAGNIYTNDLRVANIDKKIASNSKKVVIVADSSKYQKQAMYKVLTPANYNCIITDNLIKKKTISKLKKKQINLYVSK